MVSPDESMRQLEATPALVIDEPTVARNVERLASYAASHRREVRPHTKTHKSLRMAERQVHAGATGLTTAKAGEAEVMMAASRDVLVAYPVVDEYRSRHLAAMAREGVLIRTTADSPEGVERLAAAALAVGTTIGVLVDLDVGFHRTGVSSPAAALELAQGIDGERSLRLDGIFFYPGHVWEPVDRQGVELARIDGLIAECVDLWGRSGLDAQIISGGSTPTAYQSHLVARQTEIRPGTYIYNDMNTVRAGFCSLEDCAATVVCTVVSTAVAGKAVIDAGTKTLTSDRNVKFPDSGHGHVVEYPEAVVVRLSEEHGELDVSRCGRKPRIGERVSVIPNHVCPCVNLQDDFWMRRGDGTLERVAVDSRGRLS